MASLAAGGLLWLALAVQTGIVLFASYAGIGSFPTVRRPTNGIGWLLVLYGFDRAGYDVELRPGDAPR